MQNINAVKFLLSKNHGITLFDSLLQFQRNAFFILLVEY